VSVLLHVPPDVSVDVRRESRGLLVVFRSAGEPERVARTARAPEPVWPTATPPAAAEPPPARARVDPRAAPAPTAELVPAPLEPAPTPPVGLAAPPATAQATPSSDTAEMARGLFPSAQAEPPAAGTGSVAELYAQLFPTGAVTPPPEEAVEAPEVIEPGRRRECRWAPSACAPRWTRATWTPTPSSRAPPCRRGTSTSRCSPGGGGGADRGGSLRAGLPAGLRAFATYDDVNSSSHSLGARIDLPVGSRVTLRASDRFRAGVLDTRVVDPGGEYFFGLATSGATTPTRAPASWSAPA